MQKGGGDGMNTAHIVYASDDRFAEIMGISMVSLYANSTDMDEIAVYILDSGILESNKQKLELVAENYNRQKPIWLEAKDISKEAGMEVMADRGSRSQYARLFVASNLPQGVDRVLYLDCDTIICKSIRELWNLNMHGKTVSALMDAFSPQYRVNIGLGRNDIMFNSGVMLIDLVRWRMNCYEEKLLWFIRSRNGRIQQGDQGALNAVLSDDVYCFEPRFNSVTIFYDFAYEDMLTYRKPLNYYEKGELLKAINEPSIIHFTTSFLSKRPWMRECCHRYTNEWLRYKEMSPWRANALRDDNRPAWKRYGVRLYRFMPHKIALCLAGILQAYIRPQINRLMLSKKLKKENNSKGRIDAFSNEQQKENGYLYSDRI